MESTLDDEKQNQLILISIVTANSQKIFQTLDTLIETIGKEPRLKILIFDNDSTNEYRSKLKEYLKYPYLDIYFHGENNGFGYGHNHNLLQSYLENAVIFNPDILVDETTIIQLVELLKNHPECAMLAPKILNEDGSTQYLIRQRLDVFDYLLRFVAFKTIKQLFDKRLAKFECRDLSSDKDSYVRMISGSFMVVNIAKFKKVGGFDTRFFMYFEDNDLCMKFEEANEKLLYTPSYSVIHLYSKGAHRNFKLFRVFLMSMMKFFNKWEWDLFDGTDYISSDCLVSAKVCTITSVSPTKKSSDSKASSTCCI